MVETDIGLRELIALVDSSRLLKARIDYFELSETSRNILYKLQFVEVAKSDNISSAKRRRFAERLLNILSILFISNTPKIDSGFKSNKRMFWSKGSQDGCMHTQHAGECEFCHQSCTQAKALIFRIGYIVVFSLNG